MSLSYETGHLTAHSLEQCLQSAQFSVYLYLIIAFIGYFCCMYLSFNLDGHKSSTEDL